MKRTRAQRLLELPSYPFARWSRQVEDVARRGVDVIRLDIGSPDLAPPEEVIQALAKSAGDPSHHGYGGYRGLPALREAMADYYRTRFGVGLDAEREVVPLIGSKEGIVNLALACLDPGDVVLVPDPGYAPYAIGAALVGAEVHRFPLVPEHGYLPELNAIPRQAAERAALLWLNYPNNPTGATAELEFFSQAVEYARRYNLLLCHDAPYCDVTYNGYVAPSLLQVAGSAEVAIEFNSLSKTYNMAGWRIGMAVGNADVLASLAQVKSNMDSGMFQAVQDAAVEALHMDRDWIAARNQAYQERLEVVLQGLQAAGIKARRPRAGLYVWAQIPGHVATLNHPEWNSERFALQLLEQTGVAVAPGSFFGLAGEGYMRFSITAPACEIQEAMERIVSFTELGRFSSG